MEGDFPAAAQAKSLLQLTFYPLHTLTPPETTRPSTRVEFHTTRQKAGISGEDLKTLPCTPSMRECQQHAQSQWSLVSSHSYSNENDSYQAQRIVLYNILAHNSEGREVLEHIPVCIHFLEGLIVCHYIYGGVEEKAKRIH